MTVALDFDWQDPDFLLPSQGVRAAGVSEPRSGCAADTLNVRASVVRGTTKVTRAASLAVVVEKSSDDGDSWTTAHTFTFTDTGIQDAAIASTPDLLRVRWTPSGGSWSSLQLEASPAPAASEGGGSGPLVATVTLTDAQIKASPTTPVVIVPATETPNYAADLTEIPVLIGGFVLLSNYAVAYSNVNAGAFGKLWVGSDLGSLQVSGSLGALSALENGDFILPISPQSRLNVNVQVSLGVNVHHNFYDNAVVFAIDNQGNGDLVDGDPGNTIKVVLYYAVASLT